MDGYHAGLLVIVIGLLLMTTSLLFLDTINIAKWKYLKCACLFGLDLTVLGGCVLLTTWVLG